MASIERRLFALKIFINYFNKPLLMAKKKENFEILFEWLKIGKRKKLYFQKKLIQCFIIKLDSMFYNFYN